MSDYDQSYQDFVALVSASSASQSIVMGLEPMQNQQTSEIETVLSLLDKLQLKGVCFSLDVLHTQKNRCANCRLEQRLSDCCQMQSTQIMRTS